MEHTFDIFWDDLTPEAQARYRESGMTPPEDMNWDTFPMTTLYDEDEVEDIDPLLAHPFEGYLEEENPPVVDEIKQYKETHRG